MVQLCDSAEEIGTRRRKKDIFLFLPSTSITPNTQFGEKKSDKERGKRIDDRLPRVHWLVVGCQDWVDLHTYTLATSGATALNSQLIVNGKKEREFAKPKWAVFGNSGGQSHIFMYFAHFIVISRALLWPKFPIKKGDEKSTHKRAGHGPHKATWTDVNCKGWRGKICSNFFMTLRSRIISAFRISSFFPAQLLEAKVNNLVIYDGHCHNELFFPLWRAVENTNFLQIRVDMVSPSNWGTAKGNPD